MSTLILACFFVFFLLCILDFLWLEVAGNGPARSLMELAQSFGHKQVVRKLAESLCVSYSMYTYIRIHPCIYACHCKICTHCTHNVICIRFCLFIEYPMCCCLVLARSQISWPNIFLRTDRDAINIPKWIQMEPFSLDRLMEFLT